VAPTRVAALATVEGGQVPRKKNDGLPEGIVARHRTDCHEKGPDWSCGCPARYQAQVWSQRDRRRLSKTSAKLATVKRWRTDALKAIGDGTHTLGPDQTVRAAGDALVAGMKAGTVRNRSGRVYKPSVIRDFDRLLLQVVYPAVGPYPLGELRRGQVQRLADKLLNDGYDPSTVRNMLMPLRVIYRRAVRLEDTAHNPTANLELPAVEGKRERIASPQEAARLIDALDDDKALWACAFYEGLRRGELAALRVRDLDLDTAGIA
jgi:integrase